MTVGAGVNVAHPGSVPSRPEVWVTAGEGGTLGSCAFCGRRAKSVRDSLNATRTRVRSSRFLGTRVVLCLQLLLVAGFTAGAVIPWTVHFVLSGSQGVARDLVPNANPFAYAFFLMVANAATARVTALGPAVVGALALWKHSDRYSLRMRNWLAAGSIASLGCWIFAISPPGTALVNWLLG